MAQYITFCGNNFGEPIATCIPTALFGTTGTTPQKDEQWQTFKMLYLSEKQKIMQKAADKDRICEFYSTPTTPNGFCGCIGGNVSNSYNYLMSVVDLNCATPTDVSGFFQYVVGASPSDITQTPFYSIKQPCSFWAKSFYSGKTRRFNFYSPQTKTPADAEKEANYNLFKNTGLCPLALHLKDFFNEIAFTENFLNTSLALNTIDHFSPSLYTAISGIDPYNNSGSFNAQTYTSSKSNAVLTINITGATANPCTNSSLIVLTLPSFSGSLDWDDYDPTDAAGWNMVNVTEISASTGTAFKLKARIHIVTGNIFKDIIITGAINNAGCTSFNLKHCETAYSSTSSTPDPSIDLCVAGQEAIDLQELFNLLHFKGDFTSTTGIDVSSSTSDYRTIFNNVLDYYLPSSSWLWKKTATNTYEIYSTSSSDKYDIVFESTPFGAYSSTNLFASFSDVRPNVNYTSVTSTYNFTVMFNGALIPFSFKLHQGSSDIFMVSGNCGKPNIVNCQSQEHKLRNQMLSLVNAFINTDLDFTTNNTLSGTPWFGNEMHTYLDPEDTDLDPTDDAEVFTTASSGSSLTTSSIIIPIKNGSATVCTISIQPINAANTLPSTLVQAEKIIVDETDLEQGKAFNFYMYFVVSGTTYIYKGTSCFPLKNCDDCLAPQHELIDLADATSPVYYDCYNEYTDYLADIQTVTGQTINTSNKYYVTLEQFCAAGYSYCYQNYITYMTAAYPFISCTAHLQPALDMVLADFCQTNFSPKCLDDYLDNIIGAATCSSGNPDFSTLTEYCSSYPPQSLCKPVTTFSPQGQLSNQPPTPEERCTTQVSAVAAADAEYQYFKYITGLKDDFKQKYIDHCIQNAVETFHFKYTDNKYHYTLYYYDAAGNMSRTIPPHGVKQLSSGDVAQAKIDRAANARTVYTKHLYPTTYKYNTLDQLVEQTTPDGGISHFWYDALGRLRFSQNAKQDAIGTSSTTQVYSYTKYDFLGRIVEVGESAQAYSSTYFYTGVDDASFPNSSRTQITATTYDVPTLTTLSGFTQENLRNRVTGSAIDHDGDSNPEHATHYSYDIHGNVKELVQDNPLLAATGATAQQYKTIEYTYDLIANKVNTLSYQKGYTDQFFHHYEYDADNRITNAYTSRYAFTANGAEGLAKCQLPMAAWDQDAKYFYYPHGPLARMESGTEKVQGNDYAYTIHSWIKGNNSNTLRTHRDIGKDAVLLPTPTVNDYFAADEFGYSLGYSEKDYTPIGIGTALSSLKDETNFMASITGSALHSASPELFNGNIRHMVKAIRNLMPGSSDVPQAMTYKYDQLNRITDAKMYNNVSLTNNIWSSSSQSNTDYAETFRYDAGGNILKATRNTYGTSSYVLDNLHYYYYRSDGSTSYDAVATAMTSLPADVTNRLAYVNDAQSTTTDATDLEAQSAGNYTYDEIGQLNSDVAEGICSVEWTLYNKIKKIERCTTGVGATRRNIEFAYDSQSNRVLKCVKGGIADEYTWYVRDAQGNVMAVYKQEINGEVPANSFFKLAEHHVYGSSRVAVRENETAATTAPAALSSANNYDHYTGKKEFELSNHLGNVAVTYTDHKVVNSIANTTQAEDFETPHITRSQGPFISIGNSENGPRSGNYTTKLTSAGCSAGSSSIHR